MSFQHLEGINGPGSPPQTTRKCSEKSRRSEKETPRTSKALTRARPGTGEGWMASQPWCVGLWQSFHETLTHWESNYYQSPIARCHPVRPAQCTVWEWLAGTIRSVSSAYQNFSFLHITFLKLYVFEVKESISDIPTELICSGDLENLGKLPVHDVLEGTDDCVLWIFEISTLFMF